MLCTGIVFTITLHFILVHKIAQRERTNVTWGILIWKQMLDFKHFLFNCLWILLTLCSLQDLKCNKWERITGLLNHCLLATWVANKNFTTPIAKSSFTVDDRGGARAGSKLDCRASRTQLSWLNLKSPLLLTQSFTNLSHSYQWCRHSGGLETWRSVTHCGFSSS